MDQILEDYKSYYRVRMERYQNDPLFAQSYLSEKAIHDCISTVNTMNDLMQSKTTEFRELSVKNGVALVTDQANCRLQFYQKEQEDIRAKGQQQILDKIAAATDPMQIVSIVSELQTKNDVEVMVDNLWPTHFYNDAIRWLEIIEVSATAIVPDKWMAEMKQENADNKKMFLDGSAGFLTAIRNYEPGWQWNYELLWVHRHRKKSLLPDAVIQQRIEEHKALLNY